MPDMIFWCAGNRDRGRGGGENGDSEQEDEVDQKEHQQHAYINTYIN